MFRRLIVLFGFALGTFGAPAFAGPEHDAARRGDVAMLKKLLDQGISIESRDATKETPLISAALAGKHSAVRLLIERGADIHARNDRGMTALHAAAFTGRVQTAQLLIRQGANINDNENFFKIVPLYAAALERHKDVAQLLIQEGADLEVPSQNGLTALSAALAKRNWNVVKVLIAAGAVCQPKELLGDMLFAECEDKQNGTGE